MMMLKATVLLEEAHTTEIMHLVSMERTFRSATDSLEMNKTATATQKEKPQTLIFYKLSLNVHPHLKDSVKFSLEEARE